MNPIAPILLDWYARAGRDLPWRRTRDPYRIWLSEVILQQTRVAQGLEYYLRFVERFPSVGALAAASEDEVLKLWQGLGYYSRARNLLKAARQVVENFGGAFPSSAAELRRLAGVGPYTAAAIASAAWDEPCAVVDGNVYRVLARLYDLPDPIDTAAGRQLFAALAREQLDAQRPGAYNQAIMDFGATVCTPAQPACGACPLAAQCLALAAGTVAARPVRQGRQRVRPRWLHYLHIVCDGRTLLRRREGRDIWRGLWEFPVVECPGGAGFDAVARTGEFRRLVGSAAWRLAGSVCMPPHRLSHQLLHIVFHRIETPSLTPYAETLAVPADRLGDYALPRPIDRYLGGE